MRHPRPSPAPSPGAPPPQRGPVWKLQSLVLGPVHLGRRCWRLSGRPRSLPSLCPPTSALISGRRWSLPGIYLIRHDAPSSPAASTRLHHVQQKSNGVLPWFADPPLASSCSLVTSGRLGQATLLRPQGCWPLVELLLRTELDCGVVRLLRSGCLCGGRRVVNYMGSTGQGIVGNFRGRDPDQVLGALSTWAC